MPHRADADLYAEYRPHYPSALFQGLGRVDSNSVLTVCDLGAGTGLASACWVAAKATGGTSLSAVQLTLVDPDSSLLEKSKTQAAFHEGVTVHLVQSAAEKTPLDAASQDLILIGSAVHWMDAQLTAQECSRLLRSAGKLLIFEYQFPKAIDPEAAPLNEWVRRQFNEKWRAPEQRPRGKFSELLEPFARASHLKRNHPEKTLPCPMNLKLSATDFSGLLFSQSRTQHFEASLSSPEEVHAHRREVTERVKALWPTKQPSEVGALSFDFKLQFASFTKAP
jgi:ubiquinone/menaquinone biosynthesis C-methylase UbiE